MAEPGSNPMQYIGQAFVGSRLVRRIQGAQLTEPAQIGQVRLYRRLFLYAVRPSALLL